MSVVSTIAKIGAVKASKIGGKLAILGYFGRQEYERIHEYSHGKPTKVSGFRAVDKPRAVVAAAGTIASFGAAGLEGLALIPRLPRMASGPAPLRLAVNGIGAVQDRLKAIPHKTINKAILGGMAVSLPNFDAAGRELGRIYTDPKRPGGFRHDLPFAGVVHHAMMLEGRPGQSTKAGRSIPGYAVPNLVERYHPGAGAGHATAKAKKTGAAKERTDPYTDSKGRNYKNGRLIVRK